jgi:hypothetical protein
MRFQNPWLLNCTACSLCGVFGNHLRDHWIWTLDNPELGTDSDHHLLHASLFCCWRPFLIFYLGAASRQINGASEVWILELTVDVIVVLYLMRPAVAKVFHEAG